MLRWLLVAIAVAALVAVSSADTQSARVLRIGFLTPLAQPQREAAFFDELAKLGYRRDANFVVLHRSANGEFERLPALAHELAAANVDIIVASLTQAAVAAKAATSTIPIVIVAVGDPVAAGIVSSLARPGANITGNSAVTVDVLRKQLELLREVRPGLSRVAALWNPANPIYQAQQLEEAKAAAGRLGIQLDTVEAREPQAFETAFRSMTKSRAEALLIVADPIYNPHVRTLARLAREHRLPSASATALYTDAGVLLSYGADFDELHRRAARYVDRIARGTRPSDLPVERPTQFELIVNETTARALGIVLPPALRQRADRIVR